MEIMWNANMWSQENVYTYYITKYDDKGKPLYTF